jgi:hypothetical protein
MRCVSLEGGGLEIPCPARVCSLRGQRQPAREAVRTRSTRRFLLNFSARTADDACKKNDRLRAFSRGKISDVDHIEDRRQEILDGKREWNVDEFGNDYDVFFTQVVQSLRALRTEGMFEKLEETNGHFGENVHIFIVEITGAINLDFPKTGD